MNRIWEFSAFGNRTALIDDTGVTIRYDELQELQNQLSEAEGAGELTMMLCENSIGALAGYASLLNSGHPMLIVSAEIAEDMRRQIMNTYRPGLVFVPTRLREDCAHMRKLLSINDYTLFKTNYADLYPVYPDLGQLITTSGSTGSVKYVRQSWDNIRVNTRLLVDCLEMTSTERNITGLPMSYTYGLCIICASLLAGGTMIVTRKSIMDEEFWDLFENEHITAFHGVANTYDILRQLGIFDEDFPDLKLMTQAGSKLSKELHRYIAQYAADHGKRFVAMYGQCEATAMISFLPPQRTLEKAGSVGTAAPGGEIELRSETGDLIEDAHVSGELIYRGKNVALGYAAGGEDLIRGDDWHGELCTGDIAERDEDGFLYVTGRLKRFIKISGSRISLDEIDRSIMNDLHIRSVSSGMDDQLVVFVENEDEKDIVLSYLRQRFAAIRTALRVVKIDAFPVNESGKILYGALREMI